MNKQQLSLLLLIPYIGFLSACTVLDPSVVEAAVHDEISELLPVYINGSFELPQATEYTLEWHSEDVEIEDNAIVYTSPYQDTTATLVARFAEGFSRFEVEFEVPLIALDSGYIVSELSIDLPVAVYEIQRDNYTTGTLSALTEVNGETMTDLDDQPVDIRGRGNSTWWVYPKKPYRLRFPTNVSLLGMAPARNYVLLAEHADRSFIRNIMTQKLAARLEHIPHAMETRFVELTINDEYLGMYVLTEQVEFQPNRYDVSDTLAISDAGFLMEMDWRMLVPESTAIENIDYVLIKGYPYVFQEPEMDDDGFAQHHVDFMRDWITNMEMALLIRQGYDHYADIDNWIDYFLVQEITKNVDVGWSSFFFAKPTGEPLVLGPLWDFDFAYGNADYIPYGPEGWWGFVNYKNHWFTLLMEAPLLRERFVQRFNEIRPMLLAEWVPLLTQFGTNINTAATRNFETWNILNTYLWPTPQPVLLANSHTKQIEYVENYLIARIEWMDETLNHEDFLTQDFTDY